MGYNTTIFVLNDRLHDIKKNPERFVEDIWDGVYDGADHAFGQTTVMRSDHADVPRLYLTHQNSILELDRWSRRTMEYAKRGESDRVRIRGSIERARHMLDNLEDELDSRWPVE